MLALRWANNNYTKLLQPGRAVVQSGTSRRDREEGTALAHLQYHRIPIRVFEDRFEHPPSRSPPRWASANSCMTPGL